MIDSNVSLLKPCKIIKKNFWKKFGGKIKQPLQAKHISQQQLATICNFEKSNKSKIVA